MQQITVKQTALEDWGQTDRVAIFVNRDPQLRPIWPWLLIPGELWSRSKIKIKGQLVQTPEWKQTERQTHGHNRSPLSRHFMLWHCFVVVIVWVKQLSYNSCLKPTCLVLLISLCIRKFLASRDSSKGNVIGCVRPFVFLSVSTLGFEPADLWSWFWIVTIAHRGLKVKVIGRSCGSRLTKMATRSVCPQSSSAVCFTVICCIGLAMCI